MRNWTDIDSRLSTESHKTRQREDREDRLSTYRSWRWNIPGKNYVCDADQIEYRITDGKIVPVALLELTRYDGDLDPTPNYLKAITNRFNLRDGQGNVARFLAGKLGCHAYIVLFRHNLNMFWLYDLTDNRGWWRMNLQSYQYWLDHSCRTP